MEYYYRSPVAGPFAKIESRIQRYAYAFLVPFMRNAETWILLKFNSHLGISNIIHKLLRSNRTIRNLSAAKVYRV